MLLCVYRCAFSLYVNSSRNHHIFQRTLPFPFSLPFSFQKFNKKCSKYVIILVLSLLVGLMLIGIGVMMCMRRKKTPNNNDSVTLIQRGGESRLLLIFKKKATKTFKSVSTLDLEPPSSTDTHACTCSDVHSCTLHHTGSLSCHERLHRGT